VLVKVSIVVVGRARGPLAAAVADYEARAARYWKLEVLEVDAGAPRGREDDETVRAVEAERILARVGDGVEVVALTRGGTPLGSRGLSVYLGERALHSGDVAFVVGGAWGLGAPVLGRAARTLALSSMTLPHEVARLVLAEQLYRAGTILRGEPYHKGP
jgi:23S rRNA (pseudouridine1915-N3)-methyltransferase